MDTAGRGETQSGFFPLIAGADLRVRPDLCVRPSRLSAVPLVPPHFMRQYKIRKTIMKTTILPRQTLFDIALLTKGDASAAVEIAGLNGLVLTDDLTAGMVLETGAPQKNTVTNLLSQSPPATFITEEIRFQGINFMEIEGSGDNRFWIR